MVKSDGVITKMFDKSQEPQIVHLKGRHLREGGGDMLLVTSGLPHKY